MGTAVIDMYVVFDRAVFKLRDKSLQDSRKDLLVLQELLDPSTSEDRDQDVSLCDIHLSNLIIQSAKNKQQKTNRKK
jgi:hypothetical protein